MYTLRSLQGGLEMLWSVATCSSRSSRRGDTGLVLTAPQLLLDFFLFLSFTLILQLHRIGPGDFPQPMLDVKKLQVLYGPLISFRLPVRSGDFPVL